MYFQALNIYHILLAKVLLLCSRLMLNLFLPSKSRVIWHLVCPNSLSFSKPATHWKFIWLGAALSELGPQKLHTGENSICQLHMAPYPLHFAYLPTWLTNCFAYSFHEISNLFDVSCARTWPQSTCRSPCFTHFPFCPVSHLGKLKVIYLWSLVLYTQK